MCARQVWQVAQEGTKARAEAGDTGKGTGGRWHGVAEPSKSKGRRLQHRKAGAGRHSGMLQAHVAGTVHVVWAHVWEAKEVCVCEVGRWSGVWEKEDPGSRRVEGWSPVLHRGYV